MSQATIVLPTAGTVSGLIQSQNANAALDAVATGFSGASAPTEHEAYRTWYDTTNGVKMRRKADDSGYVLDGSLDESGFSSRSTNTILGLGDLDRPIRITANITQTFVACATLGAKWAVDYLIASGVTVIFDPSGSENIDGATTKTVVGPAQGFIFCDGTAFYTNGFVQSATSAQIKSGTANVLVPPDQLLTAQGFTAYYNSGNQTITAASSLTLQHGLGRQPVILEGWLKCLTAEFNYSIGMMIKSSLTTSDANNDNRCAVLYADATNANVIFGSYGSGVFGSLNRTSGAGVALTNANWAFIVEAWA